LHGFGTDHDYDGLLGNELIQICIGNNEIILRFHNGNAVSVYSLDSFLERNSFLKDDLLSLRPSSIFGSEVNGTEVDGDTLVLSLSNGRRFEIVDDSKQYESALIEINGKSIAV
jgi:hypothetical protein